MIDFKTLTADFPEETWRWRIQQAGLKKDGKPWARIIPYVDARDIQERLDQVAFPQNWQVAYEFHQKGVLATLSLRIDASWVTKQDGSDETEIEPFKGGISRALVRAASVWGIGRHLYDTPVTFATFVDQKTPDAQYVKIDSQHFYWVLPELKHQIDPVKPKGEDVPMASGALPSVHSPLPGYKIPFGKFKDKPIESIPLGDLVSYKNYLIKSSEQTKNPLSKMAIEFCQKVEALETGFTEDDISF